MNDIIEFLFLFPIDIKIKIFKIRLLLMERSMNRISFKLMNKKNKHNKMIREITMYCNDVEKKYNEIRNRYV